MPTDAKPPPPSLYDQSTFLGRFQHFAALTSPFLLLASQAQLAEARKLVAEVDGAARVASTTTAHQHGNDNDDYWRARYLLESTYHPDTNEPVLLPFRLSAFVPMNLVIIAGMLTPNPSTRSIVFWQWVNQSFNVGFNWANANKTSPMSMQETALAYGTAVTSSVGIAVGLNRVIRHPVVARFVPFVAVSLAGVLNVFLMRRKELVDGIQVCDPSNGDAPVGKSQRAGWAALSQVAASRVASAFPVLTLPPLVMTRLERLPAFQRNPRLHMLSNLAVITVSMMTALPAAIAMFPQRSTISTQYLEPRFQQLIDRRTGKPLEYVTYNKGI